MSLWGDLTFKYLHVYNHWGKSVLLTCPLLPLLPSPEHSAVANQKQTKSIYFYEKEMMLLYKQLHKLFWRETNL